MHKTKMDSNVIHALQILGLNEKEIAIYLAALELGSASIQDIAKKSKIKRVTVYTYLEDLKEKGFLSEIKKGNRRIFVAEEPKMLTVILDKKKLELQSSKMELETLEGNLGDIVQKMVKTYEKSGEHSRPDVRYYEGPNGLKKIYTDVILTGGEFLNISAWHKALKVLPEKFHRDFIDKRIKNKIFNRVIIVRSEEAQRLKENDAKECRKIRFFYKTPKNFDTEIYIYGDKIAFLSYEQNMMSVVIQNPVITIAMKNIFELLWDKSLNK